MSATPISVTFTGELSAPLEHGPTPISATFTGEPRVATGVLADDDSWHNTTDSFALMYVDRMTLVAKDAAGYAAAFPEPTTIVDESYYALNSGYGLVLVPPGFHMVIDSRTTDSYPGILL